MCMVVGSALLCGTAMQRHGGMVEIDSAGK